MPNAVKADRRLSFPSEKELIWTFHVRAVAFRRGAKASSGVSDVQKSLIPDCWACAPAYLTLHPSCMYRGHLHSTWEVGLMLPDVLPFCASTAWCLNPSLSSGERPI